MRPEKNKNQKPKTIIIATALIMVAVFIFTIPVDAQASGLDDAVNGLNRAGSQGYDGSANDSGPTSVVKSIPTAIGQIIGAGLAFIGVLFLALIIYGGVLWMLARGNDADVEKARDLIQAAVVGLIIVLAAYAITYYVSEALKPVPTVPAG